MGCAQFVPPQCWCPEQHRVWGAGWGPVNNLCMPGRITSVLFCAQLCRYWGRWLGSSWEKKNLFLCKHSWYSNNTGVFYCTAPELVHSIKLIYGCRDDGNWTAGAIGMGGMYWSVAQLWSWDDASRAGELSPGRLCPRKAGWACSWWQNTVSVAREPGEHHSSGQRGSPCLTGRKRGNVQYHISEQHLENCP